MIPAKESTLSFHSTFLIAPRRIAELGLVAPVRSEGDESRRLLPLRSPQDSLHRRLEIVISQPTEDASEIVKCQFVPLQEGLLTGMRIGAVKGSRAPHAA